MGDYFLLMFVVIRCFGLFAGITRMELLLDNATFQIYILHTSGHIQVIKWHLIL